MSVQSLVDRYGVSVSIRTKAADSIDQTGGRIETWSVATATQALFQVRSGAEANIGGAERPAQVATVYFPDKPTVTVGDRLLYNARNWEITSVRVPDERASGDQLAYTIVEVVEVNG